MEGAQNPCEENLPMLFPWEKHEVQVDDMRTTSWAAIEYRHEQIRLLQLHVPIRLPCKNFDLIWKLRHKNRKPINRLKLTAYNLSNFKFANWILCYFLTEQQSPIDLYLSLAAWAPIQLFVEEITKYAEQGSLKKKNLLKISGKLIQWCCL